MLTRYPTATQTCGRCGLVVRVLRDEVGLYDCPHCGPEDDASDPLIGEDDEDDEEAA